MRGGKEKEKGKERRGSRERRSRRGREGYLPSGVWLVGRKLDGKESILVGISYTNKKRLKIMLLSSDPPIGIWRKLVGSKGKGIPLISYGLYSLCIVLLYFPFLSTQPNKIRTP